jgi:transcriptional regulator with XRE-family HTH domain
MEDCEQYAIDVVTTFRKEQRLTQKMFAKILGVSSSFIGNVENKKNSAKYNFRHIAQIVSHFKVSPEIFFRPTT